MPPRVHPTTSQLDVDRLRSLASKGELASSFATADELEQRRTLRALYVLAWPITFARITRPVELRRGHKSCAQGLEKLAPECADRFHDDVAAVVHEVVHRANAPIADLEAWIAKATPFAAVNGYRRRRGAIGALQRPRLPGWLRERLGNDPWLTRLALHVLDWVGVPSTAGTEVWPVNSWAGSRGEITADWPGSTPEVVAAEVRTVLAAMRSRPAWFVAHVERPLGHKQAPIAAMLDQEAQCRPLALVDPHECAESRLTAEARHALRMIEARLRLGEDPRTAVVNVVRRIFCDGVAIETISHAPHDAGHADEWLVRTLHDGDIADKMVARVLDVVLDFRGAERTA